MTIEIRLSGPAAETLSRPTKDFLRTISGEEPESRRSVPGDGALRGDPVAIAALILSVPGAILATLDLVERARLAQRIRKMLDAIRGADVTAILQTDDQPAINLKEATADEVMNRISGDP